MYSKEFFVKQFAALDTSSLLDKLANQPLTDEASQALVEVLDARGVRAEQRDAQVHEAKRNAYLRTGVTNQCDFCGKGLLGAFNAEGQKFCNIDCFHTSRLRLAAIDITDEQALGHARVLGAGRCPACRRPHRRLEIHKAHFITSMVFVVITRTQSSLSCAACATRQNLWAALHCATLGWWSIKGLFITPFKLGSNLWEIVARKAPGAPSDALIDTARLDLADAALQAVRGGRWGLRP